MTNAFKIILLILVVILVFILVGCGEARAVASAAKKPPGGADVNAMLVWLTTISIMGIGACIAAAVFLPVKKLAVAIGAGFASVLAMALTVKAALPFLPWVALGVIVLGFAVGVVLFRRYVLGLNAAVGYGCAVANAVTDEDVASVKEKHAAIQEAFGVKRIIDNVLAKYK